VHEVHRVPHRGVVVADDGRGERERGAGAREAHVRIGGAAEEVGGTQAVRAVDMDEERYGGHDKIL
jgi:hypothetical protein